MRNTVGVLLALLSLVLPLSARADGAYIPKVPRDPRSHTRDITEPSQKAALVHLNGKERLILQVSYKGDVSEFAWLVPTPSRPKVSKVDAPVFHELHWATAPTVKYWLDAPERLHANTFAKGRGVQMAVEGPRRTVDVLERKEVGTYDISVLKATNAGDLVNWLRTNDYQVTPRIESVLGDYIRRGWIFTAARIRTGEEKRVAKRLSEGILQSVQLDFSAAEPVYPLKISSLNPGKTEVLLYVLADHRVETPLLTTRCVTDGWRFAGGPGYQLLSGFIDLRLLRPRSILVTKLSGDLSAMQMTHDLIPTPAPTDERFDEIVSAPFLENLGALSLLFGSYVFVAPYNLGFIVLCVGMACTRFGKQHDRAWLAAGCVAFFAPMPFTILALDTGAGPNYQVAGIATLILACVAALILSRSIIRRRGTRASPLA